MHVAVRDTGIGIPADRAHRLFEEFSQLDSSTTRKYGGTGLGLAVSKRLAELMGGTMWVESVAGEGSTFHFTIIAEAAEVPSRVAAAGLPSELVGKRVLLVDDNAINRRILDLQTEAWGIHGRSVETGDEALAMIERGDPFDLAIVDMHMPGMDGVELAHRLRALRPELPLVLYTSLGGDAIDPVFAAVLAKPVKQSQLFDLLVSLLSGGAVERVPVHDDAATGLGERHPLRILLAEDNTVNQQTRHSAARVDGVPRRRGLQWRRSGRSGEPSAVRPGADGRADAGDGRDGGRRAASVPMGRARSRASSP